jgi:MoaA/NifB/PqqE/SkfB family radical SAM enzyme
LRRLFDCARFERQQRSHRIEILPIIIVYLNNVCDSRCLTCSIWKNNEGLTIPADRQMSVDLLRELYETLGRWRPRQILLSGGEPALHPAFAEAIHRFRSVAGTVCVITNGLTLPSCGSRALEAVSEFYISFDGPDRESYRQIRGVDGFDRLSSTMSVLKTLRTRPKIVARCTLQKANVRRLPELIDSARQLGFDCISFLAVDVSSEAFSRDLHGPADAASLQPVDEDLQVMEEEIRRLEDSRDGTFIEGGPDKLKGIVRYFYALRGQGEFPAVRCNAPWMSMVIETTGQMRGCFFQPVIGDFRTVNGDSAMAFRQNLHVSTDDICARCVCSKKLGLSGLIRL